MSPAEIGVLLGDISRGDEVLAGIDASGGPELARAIRTSFKKGDEQGNDRRLRALVTLEGEGALELLVAVLQDTVEVGGIYSNLKNSVLELMVSRFPGHPKLEKPLWKAVEIDEYLNVDKLYLAAAAYDEARALKLLLPAAERGVPAALQALASKAPAQVIPLLQKALAGDPVRAGQFIEGLGKAALAPELAKLILPLAKKVPAAAVVASSVDPAQARATAEHLTSKDAQWRGAAMKAIAALPADEVFERLSGLFSAADRTKPGPRQRVEDLLWSAVPFEDSRWLGFLVERLEEEEHPKLRGLLVRALGKLGPEAVQAIVDAAKGDDDKGVLTEVPLVLGRMRGVLTGQGRWPEAGPGFLATLRQGAARKQGKHQKVLQRALKALDR